MSYIYKMSNAGGVKSLNRYSDMLAGNAAFVDSSFESIATVTVGAGGSSSVSFSSIPSTYTHLQIRMSNVLATSSTLYFIGIRLNSDASSANYTLHRLAGSGSAVGADGFSTGTYDQGVTYGGKYFQIPQTNNTATVITDIVDYANTNKHKTVRSLYGVDANGSGEVGLSSSLWTSNSAISTVTLLGYGSNFAQNSTFSLYGIKG